MAANSLQTINIPLLVDELVWYSLQQTNAADTSPAMASVALAVQDGQNIVPQVIISWGAVTLRPTHSWVEVQTMQTETERSPVIWVAQPQPLAGVDFTFTYAAGDLIIESVQFTYATSAVVANRLPLVRHSNTTPTILEEAVAANAIPALTAIVHSFRGEGSVTGSGASRTSIPMKPMRINSTEILTITASNKDAGDQISAIALGFRQVPPIFAP